MMKRKKYIVKSKDVSIAVPVLSVSIFVYKKKKIKPSRIENDEKNVIKDIKNIVVDYLIKRTAGVEDPRRFGDQLLQMDGVSLAGFSSEKVFFSHSL